MSVHRRAYKVVQDLYNYYLAMLNSPYAITITNSQSVATPTPFQQLLVLNLSKKINTPSQLQNLLFTSDIQGTNPLYAWIESYNSSFTSVYIWVNLPNGVPANGSTTIYMWIKNTNQYPYTGIRGSTTYDNGQYVFFLYQTGATSNGWTISGTAGVTNSPPTGSPYSTAFFANSALGNYMYTQLPSSITTTGSYIIQYYVYSNGLGDLFFFVNANGAGTMNRLDTRGNGYYIGLAKTSSWTSWNAPSTSLTASPNRWYLQSVVIVGGTQVGSFINSANAGINSLGTTVNPISSTYNDIIPSSNTVATETFAEQGNYIGLVGDGLGGSYITYWTGILIRAYPPNGIMPSVS